ncbi:MAG: DNA replication and repair protein RecF, partial [Candidatus Shapirobacteria bacterium]|nr:DNA replication and repair protein RecF [Candidatus Shapirobacteria bacterium]
MHLSHLTLENFRSYSKVAFDFEPKINLIIGPNGSGKTNILESIYFLASGKSFRSSSSLQLVNWDQSYTIVQGTLIKNSEPVELEVQLSQNPSTSSLSRKFLADNVVKTRSKYLGTLRTVIFEPEDIRLVTGSPTRRRDFLDSVFQTSEWRYASALSQYHRALQNRNQLLDLIRDHQAAITELFYWDQSIVKNAEILQNYRQNFIKSANNFFFSHSHPEIREISINYQPSIITADKINKLQNQEIAQGYTLVGPHRDDFSLDSLHFNTPDKNLAFWGSRGQQRLAVLALRLAQINYLEETYHELPILLLDDIFSEL